MHGAGDTPDQTVFGQRAHAVDHTSTCGIVMWMRLRRYGVLCRQPADVVTELDLGLLGLSGGLPDAMSALVSLQVSAVPVPHSSL